MNWARAARFACLAVFAAALLPPAASAVPAGSGARACPEVSHVESLGPACLRPDGLFEVFDREGRSLGTTHAPSDGAPEPEVAAAQADPLCVTGAPGTYYIRVIYARAFDDQDRYATDVGAIRSVVRGMNGLVEDSAARTGGHRRLRVLCDGSEIKVENAVLPTRMLLASFSSIVADLRQQGHTDPRQKYLVYYDDPNACVCAGQGHVQNDDRPGANNLNNGNASAMFAISYASMSTRTMLHELGHVLGAVQNSAPNTTGAWHCIDGLDTMCYADGGTRSASYSSTVCSIEVFDCNNNDYFHATPSAGSYLATHWNLASPVNRYIAGLFGEGPVMSSLACTSPEERVTPVQCTFSAADPDSSGLVYTVDWGDGTQPTRAPAAGTAPPGTPTPAAHTYATNGRYTVTVQAADESGFRSDFLWVEVEVGRDHEGPEVTLVDPGYNLYNGCDVKVTNDSYPVFVRRGCVTASVADPGGVTSVSLFVNDTLVATLTQAPWIFDFPVPGVGGAVIVVAATDAGNNVGYGYAYALMA